jgi:hypothetical protein
MRHRRGVLLATAAALATFFIVQDQFTVVGSRQYAAIQREARAGQAAPVTVDEVMKPAIARSVRQGMLWGGVVLSVGLAVVAAVGRRSGV